MIFTLPNFLSILRAPLAFAFLVEDNNIRFTAVFIAMLSDGFDGYLARHYNSASQLGALLDPLMDKFFMLFALTVLLLEQRLAPWQVAALLSRDFAVAFYGLYLGLTGEWTRYRLRSIWAGKVSTALQFFVLISLIKGVLISSYLYNCFIFLGVAALFELCLTHQNIPAKQNLS